MWSLLWWSPLSCSLSRSEWSPWGLEALLEHNPLLRGLNHGSPCLISQCWTILTAPWHIYYWETNYTSTWLCWDNTHGWIRTTRAWPRLFLSPLLPPCHIHELSLGFLTARKPLSSTVFPGTGTTKALAPNLAQHRFLLVAMSMPLHTLPDSREGDIVYTFRWKVCLQIWDSFEIFSPTGNYIPLDSGVHSTWRSY